jgi:cyclase
MEELSRTSWSNESLQQQVATLKETDPVRAARFENVHLVLPTKTFKDKFPLGEGTFKVEMIHTGGHTADSSIVYFPYDGTVFAGDLIFSRMYPYGGDPTADPDLWIEALNRIRSLSPRVIVPGHGPICGIDEVDKYVSYISETKSAMLKLIAGNKPENQAITDPSLPHFYEEGAVDRRAGSLGQWYRVWKQRTVK